MRRILYIITGIIFLAIGLIGLALPVIPQVPFLIISALFLARGSEHVRRLIISSKIYKKHLRDKNTKWLKELEETREYNEKEIH